MVGDAVRRGRVAMRVEELRNRFKGALDHQDWASVLEIGERLRATGDHGRPAGVYAFWMAIAAGRLGRQAIAVQYSLQGLAVVEPGTDLEARLLANGIYAAWLAHQSHRAIHLGQIYLQRYPRQLSPGPDLLPRVLHHTALAYQDQDRFDNALRFFQNAVEEAMLANETALASIIKADMAVAVLQSGGAKALERAEQLYQELNPADLVGRAKFVYLMGLAELLHGHGDYDRSNTVVDQALAQADLVDEALVRQRNALELLRARNYWAQGRRYEAMLHGFRAALGFQSCGTQNDLDRCRVFLQTLMDTPV